MLDFPTSLAAIVTRKLAASALTVEAALTGDRKLLAEALWADGAVSDMETAGKMTGELLEVHRQFLPNFFDL
jgi:alpha-galactosidase